MLGLALAGAWVIGERTVPHHNSGGWWSDDLESAEAAMLGESQVVFWCTPGTLEAGIDLSAPDSPFPVTVEDVSVPLLDETLASDDRFVRASTELMRDPTGADFDDRVPFEPTVLSDDRPDGWARTTLTWEIAECPRIEGYMVTDTFAVTYRVLGLPHTKEVELVRPLVLTTLPKDEVEL